MQFVYTEEQLPEIAKEILRAAANKLLCFYGAMGSGKTTLIKALLRELGAGQSGSSPTFGIVNEYSHEDGSLLGYHFDFYRIEDETEALDIGLEDYLAQDVWIFMEWPENIQSLIPGHRINLEIDILDEHTRQITMTHGSVSQ